jgi:hypothetical protein
MSDLDVNGSPLQVTESRAMARVESASVISNGAAVSAEVLRGCEGEKTFELDGPFNLERPRGPKTLANAIARSTAVAHAGLSAAFVCRGTSRQPFKALLALAIPQASNAIMRTIEKP